MTIVLSRPSRSETHPQKMRAAPLASGLSVAASVTEKPHDLAIGPALAVTSRPPVAISTNIDVHHVELRRPQHLHRRELLSSQLRAAVLRSALAGAAAAGGCLRNCATTSDDDALQQAGRHERGLVAAHAIVD